MRKDITLYLNGKLADVDAENLILLNYASEELSNPTIVKNNYSHEVSLPRSARNNRIFESFIRSDHRTTENGFDAMRKTAFSIFDGNGARLEHGYFKLNSVSRTEYKITLYGGLGSFFYDLSYNQAGEKRTLADLDFGEDLGFTINRDTIKTAWENIGNANSKWNTINFAPCYNGIPSDFDADKVLVNVINARSRVDGDILPQTINGLEPHYGFGLAKLDKPINEWVARDLRSYLQRPAINVWKVFQAICNPANNGGYTVDWSVGYPYETWMTLKPLTSINIEQSQTITTEGSTTADSTAIVFESIPRGTDSVDVFFRPSQGIDRVLYTSADITYHIDGTFEDTEHDVTLRTVGGVAYQVIARNANGFALANSEIVICSSLATQSDLERMVAEASKTGKFKGTHYRYVNGYFNGYDWNSIVSAHLDGNNFASIEIVSYPIFPENDDRYYNGFFTENEGTDIKAVSPELRIKVLDNSVANVETTSARSDVAISQADLLGGTITPCDFLLSLAKMYRWKFYTFPNEEKVIHIAPHQLIYNDTIDITKRVDFDSVNVKPVFADARKFSLECEVVGALADKYKDKYGIVYGAKRVDTGFEFSTETKNLLDKSVFKGAVQMLETNPMYNAVSTGTDSTPHPKFGWQQIAYTLTYGTGESNASVQVNPIVPSIIEPSNSIGYLNGDSFPKIQLYDKSDKSVSGENILLYRDPDNLAYTGKYYLSDDTDIMFMLNDNKPCWLWDFEGAYMVGSETIPQFTRYMRNDGYLFNTLDYANSAELYDPFVTGVNEGGSIYNKYWSKYVNDRYNKDTRVLSCKVDLSGMKVDSSLFGHLYYYDNAIWMLNKVSNHSLTTDDLTECEFVKVNDKQNYGR